MTIESFVLDYLAAELHVPVTGNVPSPMPASFVTVEQTGSSVSNHIPRAEIAIESWAPTRSEAMALGEAVKQTMAGITEHWEVSSCRLRTFYNDSDTETKTARYLSVFEIIYLF
jgi:hypothetical protein